MKRLVSVRGGLVLHYLPALFNGVPNNMDDLNKFLSVALSSYVDKPEFRDVCDAIVPWDELKLSAELQSFVYTLNTKPRNLACFEIKQELLARSLYNPTGPEEFDAFKQAFDQAKTKQSFKDLAERLASDPAMGQEILDAFKLKNSRLEYASLDQVAMTEIKRVHQAKKDGEELVVCLPGWEKLSRTIGGFNPARLIMIQADSGFGKTILNINLSLAASHIAPVGYINMEMSFRDMGNRGLAIATGTPYKTIDQLSEEKALETFTPYAGKIFLTNGKGLSSQEIISLMRLFKFKHGCGFIFIDYDLKIKSQVDKNTPEWAALQNTVGELEDVAKELGLCLIMNIQQNRSGEIASSHRIKFAAHTIINFRYHEGDYILHIVKNRHGEKDRGVTVNLNKDTSQITEIEEIEVRECQSSSSQTKGSKNLEKSGLKKKGETMHIYFGPQSESKVTRQHWQDKD